MPGIVVLRGAMFGDVVFLAIAPESIGFLSMHTVVTDDKILLRHAQGDDETDDVEDDAGDDQVPTDDEVGTH
jgi:hypothetical protein